MSDSFKYKCGKYSERYKRPHFVSFGDNIIYVKLLSLKHSFCSLTR